MDTFGPEELNGRADKLPDDCKPVASTSAGLFAKQSNSKFNHDKIKNVTKLMDLVKSGATNDLETVSEAIRKANIKGLDKERFLWLTCKSFKKPNNVKVNLEEARKQMLSHLQEEKKRRTEKLITKYATLSAETILIEFLAVLSVWELIKSAKSEVESCEKKFDEIERLLANHKKMADQLKRCIKEYLHSSRPEEREKMRDLTFELALDLRVTKKMIGKVQVKLKNKITSIRTIAKQKFKFYICNFAPAFVSGSVLYKLWENITESQRAMLTGITVALIALPCFNTKNYFNCNQILGELCSSMEMIEQFDNDIQEIEETIRRAQELVECDNLPEKTS